MKMKIFRDFSQPFRWTCGRKMGIVLISFLVFFCANFAVSLSSASENVSVISSSFLSASPAVISTNFAYLKNNTFKSTLHKKHGKYASFKTSTSVYTTTDVTSETTKVPSLPTQTTEVITEKPPTPPPSPPIVSVANFTSPVSTGNYVHNQTSEEIPDQIASGSDHEFVRISAPHHSILAPNPDTDFVNTYNQVGSPQEAEASETLSHAGPSGGDGSFAPPAGLNFPNSFEKFGVQDSFRYKNEFVGVGGGAAQSSSSGTENSPGFKTGFTVTPQPPGHLATSFQHSGGFSRSQGARSLSAPLQPTSGGAYQFPGGGLHEISPFGGSPPPHNPAQSFSPYNTNGHESPSSSSSSSSGGRGQNRHYSSSPPNLGSLNNVRDNFAAAVPPSTGFQPVSTNYDDSWQPTENIQPKYSGGAQRRSDHHSNDPLSKIIKHKARQSHASHNHVNEETHTPQSSETPSFDPSERNAQGSSHESFLGSFKTGDMPQELHDPKKKHNGNVPQQMSLGSENHFSGSHPDNSESQQEGFNGFGTRDMPQGGPQADSDSNESQNFGEPPQGNSPVNSHESRNFGGPPQGHSHESQNNFNPPPNNFNGSPEEHSNHPQAFPRDDFPSKPHSPKSNVGFAPASSSKGFGDFGGFHGGNIPLPEKFHAAPEEPKFPNHPFHSPPAPGSTVTFHGYDDHELPGPPQQQNSPQNHFSQPHGHPGEISDTWPNPDTPKHPPSHQQFNNEPLPHHHPQSFGGFPGNSVQEQQGTTPHAAPQFGGFSGGNQGQQHQSAFNQNFGGNSHVAPQHHGAPQGFNHFNPPQQQVGAPPQGFNNFQPPQPEAGPPKPFANFRLPKQGSGPSQGFNNFQQPQGRPDAPQSLNYFQPPQPLQAPPPPSFGQFQPSHSGSDESKGASNEPGQGHPQSFGGSGEAEETPNPQGPPTPPQNFQGFSARPNSQGPPTPPQNFQGFSAGPNPNLPKTPQQHHQPSPHSPPPGFGGFSGENGQQDQPQGFSGFGKFPGENADLSLKQHSAAPPQSRFPSFQGSETDVGPYPPEGPLLEGFQDAESSASDENSVEQSPPPGFEAQGFNAFQHENSPFQGLNQRQPQQQQQPFEHNSPQQHHPQHNGSPNYPNNQPIPPRSQDHAPPQLYPTPQQIQNAGNPHPPPHIHHQGPHQQAPHVGHPQHFPHHNHHHHQNHQNNPQFPNFQQPQHNPAHLHQHQPETEPIQNFGQNYPIHQNQRGFDNSPNVGQQFPNHQHPLGSIEDLPNVGGHFPNHQHPPGGFQNAPNVGHNFPNHQHPPGGIQDAPNVGPPFPNQQHHHPGSIEDTPSIGFPYNPPHPQNHGESEAPINIDGGPGGGSVEYDHGNQGNLPGPINNFGGGGGGVGPGMIPGGFRGGGMRPGPAVPQGPPPGLSEAPGGGEIGFGGGGSGFIGPDGSGSGSIEGGDGGHHSLEHHHSNGPNNLGYGGGGGGGRPGLGLGLLKDDKKNGLTIKQKLKYPIAKVIKIVIDLAHKILSFYAKFAIPKEHYLRVISFAGVYLLLAWLYKDNENLLLPKCESWGWNGPEEFTYHAPARFVPSVPVDQKMQREFLDLFRGVENCLDEKVEKDKKKKKKKDKKRKKNKDKNKSSSSSSEEDDISDSVEADYSVEIGFINDMCPKGQFFYSMSPYHIEAWTTLSRMFVAQKSPADVLNLARSLLHSRSVNPKVWYLGLMSAAQERPDMTGFALAHPIDAMPDLFVPGHLIEHEMNRYRGGLVRKKRAVFNVNSTLSIANQAFDELLNGTLMLERGQAEGLGNNETIKHAKMLRRSGDSSEEDDEADEDDDDDDDRRGVGEHKKKHPLGYGYGTVGDRYAGVGNSNRQPQNKHKGDGGDNGGDDDKKKKKEKGKGKKKKGKGKKKDKKKCIIVDGSVGLDNGIENKLWYWREDMMLNQHHAYWHQVYAINATMHGDRRAELFFSMHRNFLSRYNAERLSNGFARTVELGLYPGAIIEEGYDSHILDVNSGQWWTPRAPQTPLQDLLHIHDPDMARDIIINDVRALYNKFVKAIKWGKLLTAEGKFLPIKFHEGLQPLANTIEASNLSVNPFYYDAFGLHNLGHLMVALATDPDYSKQLPTGIMGEAAVSMRDPAFYTYHAIIDNLFEKFKQTLVPYKPHGGVWPLQWHGVDIVDVKLVAHGSEGHNQLTTFYIKHKYQLEPGVDRSVAKGIEKAEICAVHLDHAPFQFQIMIDRKKCAKSKSAQGTVRLFMAPRYNEHGDRLPLVEQRRLMFQLDAFQVELKVGRNIITRNSRDNSLTHPWSRSLKDYERGPDPSGAADYCGCGWPHHLFIPKGNTQGMQFDLFVMVTNFDEDYVPNHPVDMEMPETCNSPYIFCGHPRRRYPDARPMLYPFDRPPTHVPLKKCGKGLTLKDLLCKLTGKFLARPAATLEEYVSIASNMAMTVFEIKHIPKVVGKHYG